MPHFRRQPPPAQPPPLGKAAPAPLSPSDPYGPAKKAGFIKTIDMHSFEPDKKMLMESLFGKDAIDVRPSGELVQRKREPSGPAGGGPIGPAQP